MLIWIVFAVLTAGAAIVVLAPLGRAGAVELAADRGDAAVYRDQLAEIERERAEGRLADAEFAAARAEVARRLIAADEAAEGRPLQGQVSDRPRRVAVLTALIGIPAIALGLYLGTGNPELPGQPLAARTDLPLSGQSRETLVARVEAHLAANPEDGAGWEVLAPVYLRLGRPADAVAAWRNAVRILGSNAPRQSGLGEAIVATQAGVVTVEARRAFETALAHDEAAIRPQFYLALAHEQDGDLTGAARRWRDLLADAPADAPWRAHAIAALQRVAGTGGAAPMPGPSAEDVAAASALSQSDRQAMIEGMVAGLAGRLAEDGDDPDGWLRLIRAYAVLGRTDDAAAAVRTALAEIADPGGRDRVEALAAELGIGNDEGTAKP